LLKIKSPKKKLCLTLFCEFTCSQAKEKLLV